MTENMIEALNKQVNRELYSSYLYLGMAAYFENKNLQGFSGWMRIQAQEEMTHAMKIYDFILDRGGKVVLLPIEAPESVWESPLEVFEATYEHEKAVTKMINDLVKLSIDTNDYATHAFLQWFVTEQVEEEASVGGVLEKLKLAGDSSGLLFLDAELGKRPINASLSQAE